MLFVPVKYFMIISSDKIKHTAQLFSILLLFIVGCSNDYKKDNVKTPIQGASVEGCYLEDYQDADDSLYILPYEVNQTYLMSQGNCGWITHQPKCVSISPNGVRKLCGDLRYSYDFNIPIGEKIIAARNGVVFDLQEHYRNNDHNNGQENYVSIQHEDGTIASYVHLSPDAVLVKKGENVTQGQIIAIAGNSGYTGGNPHLHFHVLTPPFDKCTAEDYSGCKTIPVLFANADPLDRPLLEGKEYKALKY